MSPRRNAIIIGGTHGIGLATAQLLQQENTEVLITGRSQASAQDDHQRRAHFTPCDITSLDSIHALSTTVETLFGAGPSLDLIYINAGYAHLEPFSCTTADTFHRTFDTNVFGAFFVAQTLAPRVRDGGAIVFTTAVWNKTALPGSAVYSASKAAVHSLVLTLAAELAPRRVRVTAVSPGFVKTPTMGVVDETEHGRGAFEEEGGRVTPLGRVGRADEVARAVVFLAFEATFTTASEVVVDGGLAVLQR